MPKLSCNYSPQGVKDNDNIKQKITQTTDRENNASQTNVGVAHTCMAVASGILSLRTNCPL